MPRPHHGAKLFEPSRNVFPIPARCFEGISCEHDGQCPKIWVRQDFLLRPQAYSDYWSVSKDDLGRFIVKSSHQYGKHKENYRTFIWRVTNETIAMEENPNETLWLAVWVD